MADELSKTEQRKADEKRKAARERKRKSRAKAAEAEKAEAPVQMVSFETYPVDRDELARQAKIRGLDSVGEYLLTLMRIDGVRIGEDQAAIGTCGSCNLPLPVGCKQVFKGQNGCEYLAGLPLVEAKK